MAFKAQVAGKGAKSVFAWPNSWEKVLTALLWSKYRSSLSGAFPKRCSESEMRGGVAKSMVFFHRGSLYCCLDVNSRGDSSRLYSGASPLSAACWAG